ncbi:hypothetical protein L1987_85438 [Smallanthus sonchifolius]|uniref:Uncharacterized protein n=1 Tax=Smallanthus sonchifolius TaxID=185202 RepID=A0ACB8XVZ1_9ASTR|nr:hypothetical protein L1987_85438 [Smallanthus sonchifolius]
MTNGYLETSLDWIPKMKNIRLKDFPSFFRTTDINDVMLNSLITKTAAIPRGIAIILNTFDALEQDSVKPLLAMNPQIFTIGPLHMMQQYVNDDRLKPIGSNLWKEDASCIDWLDTKDPGSVVYVNFGSITITTKEQLIEFGWGLANSKKDFLWITRPDIVGGDEAMMPPEFVEETKGRGMVTSWCPQEEEIVMEIDTNVKREEVEAQVREMMDGKKGKMMKNKALEWKKKSQRSRRYWWIVLCKL